MKAFLPLLGLLFLAVSMSDDKEQRRETAKKPKRGNVADEKIRAIIRDAARRNGVPEPVALATAWIESGFNPYEEGDLGWHQNAERFESVVPQGHPHRWDRKAWHSYGLFQLLAPYFVRMQEHPADLLSPELNADRGTKYLARLMKRHSGDLDEVRLAYVGLPVDRRDALAERVLTKWHKVLRKFGYDDPRL